MAIEWFSEKDKDLVATIAKNNITLNKPACECIPLVYNVMLGISKEDKLVYIKSLTKEMVLRGDIEESHRYGITIRTSYGRISNKEFIKRIGNIVNNTFDTPAKYYMRYDAKEQMLIIDLNREV